MLSFAPAAHDTVPLPLTPVRTQGVAGANDSLYCGVTPAWPFNGLRVVKPTGSRPMP